MDSNPDIEYNKILQMIEDPTYTKDDVYSELMKKEQHVLDTITRISNQKMESSLKESQLAHMNLFDISVMFATSWKNIIKETINMNVISFDALYHIFWEGDRKIYVGMGIVLFAMFLFFVDITI